VSFLANYVLASSTRSALPSFFARFEDGSPEELMVVSYSGLEEDVLDYPHSWYSKFII
jgi:hypothetical protein